MSEKLPVVDQTIINEFVVSKDSPILTLIDDFDRRHPALGNVMAEFQALGDDIWSPMHFGALITAVLLEQAQKKIGGTLPSQISEDVIRASMASILDSSLKEVQGKDSQLKSNQKELFNGLRYFSNSILRRESAVFCETGGLITLISFTHFLEAQELAKKLHIKS